MDEQPDEGPVTALDYLYEAGEHSTVVDLLIEILVAHGLTEAQINEQLEQACHRYLADQREQWWEV